ncbi:Mu transposase C-terminal domain-containing protein [Cohnella cholangitidis]|uniref:Transposase-like Mu C-terminal domain-containing protein n=1 Tax=Cohnella cholangitidis TaxID=2598458 RepID=A0A7G5C476_9BACL|nr:Mu transposase C-terminal domain-containing protein [Cohnella cholangitidis]QMV44010.1 hypothetical protein FPL14_24670 [Cohnella cholangitidis]
MTLPFSKRDMRITLCGGSERRKIQSKGILLSRGWYQSPELMALRTRMKQEGNEDADVVVRFDFADVRKVFVENPYDLSFIDAELDPNTIRDYQKHFDVIPDLPLPFQQIKAISLKMGRDEADFDDVPIADAIAKIRAIEESQDKDKKKGYKETIAQEASIIEALAKCGATLDDLTPLNEADSFAFIGEVSEAELKQTNKSKNSKKSEGASKSKKRGNKLGKGPLNQENQNLMSGSDINYSTNGNNESTSIDDDLPDYDVSFMRRM